MQLSPARNVQFSPGIDKSHDDADAGPATNRMVLSSTAPGPAPPPRLETSSAPCGRLGMASGGDGRRSRGHPCHPLSIAQPRPSLSFRAAAQPRRGSPKMTRMPGRPRIGRCSRTQPQARLPRRASEGHQEGMVAAAAARKFHDHTPARPAATRRARTQDRPSPGVDGATWEREAARRVRRAAGLRG